MQATMLPFPYSLSCPPFLDMSDGMTSSAAGTPSPPAISYVSRFYDSMFVTAASASDVLPPRQIPTGNMTPHSTSVASDRGFKQTISRKKSFTIEAILGLNSYAEERQQDSAKDNLGPTRLSDHRRHERLASPAPYGVPSATPRSALTTMSAVFSSPSSTETSAIKGNKIKSSHVNTVKDPASHCNSLNRLSSSQNGSPKSSSSVCSSLVGSQKTTGGTGKAKRIRTIFTPEQLERLESEFERQQYMVGPERLYLASTLSLTEAQVKVWFQNRRIKWRKQHLEMQQARLAQLRAEAERDNCETTTEGPTSHHSDVTTTAWTDLLDDRK